MKIRLSNRFSFAVEFSAATQQEFNRAIRIASMEYFAHEGKYSRAEIQVKTDNGNWVSGNYPPSNYGPFIEFGRPAVNTWDRIKKANLSGTFFEYEIDQLKFFLGDDNV